MRMVSDLDLVVECLEADVGATHADGCQDVLASAADLFWLGR